MAWLQLHIETHSALAPRIEECLSELGAISVTLQDNADQPVLEPGVGETPLWDSTRLTGLFDADTDQQLIIDSLTTLMVAAGDAHPRPSYHFELLADQDWERNWLSHFEPTQFGDRLWICPSWHQAPDDNAVNVLLDPGLAFGTGTHPTTALCMEWLDQANLKDKVVLDYGCGSGILAISALLLGARYAVCIDNDPQALIATQNNARQNKIPDSAITICSPEKLDDAIATLPFAQKHFDVLIANILAGPLIELAETFCGLMAVGGEIVLSGILDSQADQLIQNYQPSFTLDTPVLRNEWVRLNGYCTIPME